MLHAEMAFHEASGTPLVGVYHAGLAAATGGQLAGRLSQLPELAQPAAMSVSDAGFPSAVVHVSGARLLQPPDSLLPPLNIAALPSCSHGSHYLFQRLAGAGRGDISRE